MPFLGKFLGRCLIVRARPDALYDVAKFCGRCGCTRESRDDASPQGADYFQSTQKAIAWQNFLTHAATRSVRHSAKIVTSAVIVHAFEVIRQTRDSDDLPTQPIYLFHLLKSSNVVNVLQFGAKIEERGEVVLG